MRTLQAIRYVSPLKEGGSLPAIVEASDGRLWVVKFRGAGQGARALVAEWICGELARACGFAVPELARVDLDAAFGRNEPDPEIRDLLRASHGANLGLAFLPGALTYDPIAPPEVDEALASELVWFDAMTLNVDRSPRNPNLLLAGGQLWLIDHGAALYFHHSWATAEKSAQSPFAPVRDHVLLPRASALAAAGERLRAKLATVDVRALLAELPDEWLAAADAPGDPAATREAYARWLAARIAAHEVFTVEADRARSALV
ncbi:MAG: aminotransferase class I and II [Candidatus Eisenbacteria bacterium]|uniref:Aminotransferase class I and II n=1 Tax=Eiseniibacteriota bacterium TaxID=2212470 RepID=A0A933W458_UNCEI|nr:aminotransferase class I and II [Candidatus Eisenbacteria bacterium]